MSYLDLYKARINSNGVNSIEIFTNNGLDNYELIKQSNPLFDIYINNEEQIEDNVHQVVIQEDSKTKNDEDKKILYCDFDDSIKNGDYFKFKNKNWLLVDQDIKIIDSYKKFFVNICRNNLRWVDENGLHSFPCVYDVSTNSKTTLDESASKPIIIQDYGCNVIVQNNQYTDNIKLNNRFIFGKNVYKLDNIENSFKENILFLTMTIDQKSEYDDFENQIAYNGNNYRIETNIDDIENIVGYDSKIIADVYKNDIKIDNPMIEYKSNNEEIVTIDNDGNFELLSNGSTEIEVIFGNEKVIIPVTVDLVVVEDVKFNMNPNITKITKFESEKSIEIEKLVNGMKVTEALSISYNVTGRDSDSTYEISIVDNVIKINNISARNSKVNITVDDGIGNIGNFEILLTVY